MSNASAEVWPADAVPEHWVTELFKRMGRMWGNAFLEKWPQDDLQGVKIEWARGLRKLSTSELKSGVDALLTLKFPPSLPEFYGLCKQMRLHEMPRAEALTDQTKADPETVRANLERMREIIAPLLQPREITAEWAYKLLMRGESRSGKALTHEVIRCASDAISSSAGRRVVENCQDPELRESYRTIREAIVDSYRAIGKPLWEVA
ncbi:hypothetical protein [Burkholderia cenocepacia]|uniref:hypothetical protein n=1 Tax=Burkholderia cenocepacia TaxID=95486 RepID=UPI002018DEAC|nr:hypothetical protein [Burkholderia cenocepacia]MCO1396397.1 hypothetical protein [Burkholderia cenocepacia]MCO1408971.1 hypothetical protein [Burkholderia cenocepacia]UQN92054.1 hypothetical protein L0Z06_15140 [Burkholderia cenocepacia]UQN99203.1 hypothetical protein L0Z39_16930 [Burkholderia cenocepacia]UQP50842.1 hypothetical protein L0Y99_10315 [Burkholderia cenocepacia]